MIKLVIGLGNPGERYAETRHNIGFMVVDHIVKSFRNVKEGEECFSHTFRIRIWGRHVIFAKPQTFMNNSGVAVLNFMEEYDIQPEEMLVIYDDLDLPFGITRIKPSGGSGGHKGVESIIKEIKTEKFPRLKVGIGRPKEKGDVINYVLSPFTEEEKIKLYRVLDKAKECVLRSIELSLERAMEFCNRKDT